MVAVSVTFLFSLDQTSWGAVLYCNAPSAICNGTPGDDIIVATSPIQNFIHGLGGNDYIKGQPDTVNYLFGDDGNDTLIGGNKGDVLDGGRGNDRYDGLLGGDTIEESTASKMEGSLVNNDDIISGGEGDDYIVSAEGVDIIHGGPGMDRIFPDGWARDFSYDFVDCGSDTDAVLFFYSGDPDYATNCENIQDYDR